MQNPYCTFTSLSAENVVGCTYMKSGCNKNTSRVDKDKWPPVTVAISGMLGSGKSTVARILGEKGLPVIDCDCLARRVTAPGSKGLSMVREAFGAEMIRPDGSMDRPRMLEMILHDKRTRQILEDIVHPLVLKELDCRLRQLAEEGHRAVVVEVPLLFEAGWHDLFDMNCVVMASEDACISRIMARNQVDENTARKWQKLQMPPELKEQMADFVIRNDSTIHDLEQQAGQLYRRIRDME